MNTRLGLRDNPIDAVEEECLGLDVHARALTQFVTRCETPMTIALQGDWGCGKTSMMNLIRNSLSKKRIGIIWFNTWQYSQFKQEENLPMLLLSHLVNAIGSTESKKWLYDLWNISRKATEAALLGAATVIGQKDTAKVLTEAFNRGESLQDPTKIICGLRSRLEKSVFERKKKENLDRFVIFIDDLDRLKPIRAIELLEYLKLFLDLEHCVFLLSLDYHIVVEGLKDKFGFAEAARSAKSFFDKLIQVPFNMPVESYQINHYIRKLLSQTDIEYSEYDLALYRSLTEKSIGFNPRTLKRVFNSLYLMRLVANEMGYQNQENGITASTAEMVRIMFGTLCIQFAFPGFYTFLNSRNRKGKIIERFSNSDWIDADEFDTLRKSMYRELTISGNSIGHEIERVRYKLEKIAQFMKVFLKAIKLSSSEGVEELTEADIINFIKMTEFSNIMKAGEANTFTEDSGR